MWLFILGVLFFLCFFLLTWRFSFCQAVAQFNMRAHTHSHLELTVQSYKACGESHFAFLFSSA